MPANIKLKISRELLWWVITFLLVYAILYPITKVINYKFVTSNAILIIIAITYFRSVIFFKDLLIFRNKWVRLAIFMTNIYLFIFIFSKVQDFNVLFDTFKISEFANHLKEELNIYQEGKLLRYIYHEVILTLTASIIMVVALNVRLLVSYFTKRQRRLDAIN